MPLSWEILTGSAAFGVNAMLVFGFVLSAGVLGGILSQRVRWLPTITAFMLLGLVIGPYGLGLLSKSMLSSSSILIEIAIGLILYKLGTMLDLRQLVREPGVLLTSVLETVLTFGLVYWLMQQIGFSPVLATMTAAIAVSASPAVLIHVSHEMKADGPVTSHARTLVALNNIFSYLLFSITLPFALKAADYQTAISIGLPLTRLLGGAAIALLVGYLATRISRLMREEDSHYQFALVIGAIMCALGLAQALEMSYIFTPLMLGLAVSWFDSSKQRLADVGLGAGGDLFMIVLFVMAGAKINPAAMSDWSMLGIVLSFVVLRSLCKLLVPVITAPLMGLNRKQGLCTGLLLVPMAGMAIGLVQTTNTYLPSFGAEITTIVLASVVVFETIGPFIAAFAFRFSGEAGKAVSHTHESDAK